MLLELILTAAVLCCTSGSIHHNFSSSPTEDSRVIEHRRYCNFTGAALFCQSNKPVDLSVCYYCVNNTPVCRKIPYRSLICQHGSVYIEQCSCITHDYLNDCFYLGKCLYNCIRNISQAKANGYTLLPMQTSKLNVSMCYKTWNHDRALCGRCKKGYYSYPYSYNLTCTKCTSNNSHIHFLYLTLFICGPLTFFCLLIMFFNINATSSHIHGFILFAQIVSVPPMIRFLLLACSNRPNSILFIKIIGACYSMWNFDVLRPFSPNLCIHANTFDMLNIDLFTGFYSLLLLLVVKFIVSLYDQKFKPLVILWRPFNALSKCLRKKWNIQTSLVDSFATFLLLSNGKFLSVCFETIIPEAVFNLSSSSNLTYYWGAYSDPSLHLLQYNRHVLLAFTVLLVFAVIPILLLCLYPFHCCHKCLNYVPIQWQALHTFMDSFQAGYKNGIDRSRDWRSFSSIFLLSRVFLFIIYAGTLSLVFFSYASILIVLLVISVLVFQPFKKNSSNSVNCGFLLLLATWLVCISGIIVSRGSDHMTSFFFYSCAVVAVLPMLLITGLLLYAVYLKRQSHTN